MLSPSQVARRAPFVREAGGIFEYKLRINQMKILLAPIPSARVAAVVQHVRVGSRHEGVGNTGYAHITEHEMFKGSTNFNKQLGNDYDWFMKFMGGVYNATTGLDRTNYFGLVPSAYVRQYLAYEADRLVHAFINDEDLQTEMPVVADEFGIQENEPDSMISKLLMSTMFTEHPYKSSVIGSYSDIQHVTAAALKTRFYDVYYHPNNVTLIVAGGFDRDEVLSDIIELYGKIPPSRKPIPQTHTVEPPQCGERRFVINKPGDLPRLIMGFHIPGANHPDTHALQALSLILGGGPASRLYRKLVNKGLASVAYSHSQLSHDPGVFQVYAKLTVGTRISTVEHIILDEIERMSRRLVSKRELSLVKELNRHGTILLRANLLGFAKSISEHEACADWYWGEQYDDWFNLIAREDILAVAQKYLTAANRTVGSYIPEETHTPPQPVPDRRTDSVPAVNSPAVVNAAASVKPTSLLRPQVRKSNYAETAALRVLPNGLTVVLLRTNTAALGVNLVLNSGSSYCPDNKMLGGVVSNLLGKGSARYSKAQIATLATRMGISLGFESDAFRTSLNALVPGHISSFLDLVADGLRRPRFEQQELDLLKTAMLAQQKESEENTALRANIALRQALYQRESVYHADSLQTRADKVLSIDRDDLVEFHRAFYGPKGAVLTVVGNLDISWMFALIEAKFGTWTGGVERPEIEPLARGPEPLKRIDVPIAGKDNLTIVVGHSVNIASTSPDFLAAAIGNKALGGDTLTARLGKRIREERGLTYGISSGFSDASFPGAPWSVRMTTNRSKVQQAIPLIFEVVNEYIQDGIAPVELETEKIALSTSFDLQMDNPLSIARTLSGIVHSGRELSTLDAYQSKLVSIKKEEVDDAIGKYFKLDEAVMVVAGNL